mgnify:FL=1
MDIVCYVLSVQVFTVIFNTLLNWYVGRMMLDYDYDNPNMKEFIYREMNREKNKNVISKIKNSLANWIPIRSQLYLLIEIYVILNFDAKMNLLHNLTPREWMCNELLKEQKKEITPKEA